MGNGVSIRTQKHPPVPHLVEWKPTSFFFMGPFADTKGSVISIASAGHSSSVGTVNVLVSTEN